MLGTPEVERVAPAARWTYAEFLRIPEDGRRHEILEGTHVSEAMPATPHQQIATRLAASFFSQFGPDHYAGFFTSPVDVVLADDVVVEPDLSYVSPGRLHIVRYAGVFGPPDLVIEIVSPSTEARDRTQKRDIYGRHGVREYWVVGGPSRVVTQFVLPGDPADRRSYGPPREYGTGEVLASPVTGWRLAVGDLFPKGGL